MKKKKSILIISLVVIFAVGTTTAFALSANVSDIEQKWYEFKEAVSMKMVQDGKMTQEKADEHLANLEERISESEEDVVFNRVVKNIAGKRTEAMKDKIKENVKRALGGKIVEVYAEMLGVEPEQLKDALVDAEQRIFEYAEANGDLEELKEKLAELRPDRVGKEFEGDREV